MKYVNHCFKLIHIVILFLFVLCKAKSQSVPIYIFDNLSISLDSIKYIDTVGIGNDVKLPHFVGSEGKIQLLDIKEDQLLPYPNAAFYPFQKAATKYDLESFPISAMTKILILDSLHMNIFDVCSATIIGSRYALSAAHCFTKWPIFNSPVFKKKMTHLVCPIFDEGQYSQFVECASIDKLYIFTKFNTDFALIELDKNLGNQTGWLGLTYQNEDTKFKEKLFYNFSYPATKSAVYSELDSTVYNGDTLYYRYGMIDNIQSHCLHCGPIPVIAGQSGSSLFELENYKTYSIHGVMSSVSCHFNRINAALIKTYADILQKNTYTKEIQPIHINVHPNPTTDVWHIESQQSIGNAILILFDMSGKIVLKKQLDSLFNQDIDTHLLPSGTYHIMIQSKNHTYAAKLIKI